MTRVDATNRRLLGRSQIDVTALGFGGAALGNLYAPVSDEIADATVAEALGRGIAYFDTAPYYGYGLSEQRLGRALAGVARDRFRISSKVGRLLVPRAGAARDDQGFVDANAFDPVFDYSYDGVMRSFEASLARLGIDRIDVVLLHDVGVLTHGDDHLRMFDDALDGGLRALNGLRETGAVGAIGLGVNETAVCLEALDRSDFDCFLLAGRYTLLEQAALDALLPACAARGTSLIVGGPYNSGVLVEDASGAAGAPGRYDYAAAPREVLERVARLRAVCADSGVPLPAAALQFPLLHPAVASVIPGARTPGEVAANADWMNRDIPATLWTDLRDAGLIHPDAPVEAPAQGERE